jgi:hypothetical protein
MKVLKASGLVVLALALVVAAYNTASADPNTKASQIVNLVASGDGSNLTFTQIMPDGSTKPFELKKKQYLVVTYITLGFIPSSKNSGPFRLAIQSRPFGTPPTSNRFYNYNLDLMKDNDDNVARASLNVGFNPGLAFYNNPYVQGLLPPVFNVFVPNSPADFNNGSPVPGTFSIRLMGYTVP